jgi:hypothetical protein
LLKIFVNHYRKKAITNQNQIVMNKEVFAKSLMFVFTIVFLISCKEDEEPKLEFVTDKKTVSLQNANLFYAIEGGYEGAVNYTYRDYLISDGELIDGENGWSIDDYSNATYLIAFEIAVAEPAIPAAGNYPIHRFWDNVTDGSNLGFFYAIIDGEVIDTPGTNPPPNIIIEGGIEPGDEMSIRFNGEVGYRIEGGSDFNRFDCSLNFRGKVIDKRQ